MRQCGVQPLYKTFHYKSIVYLGFSPSIFTAYIGMILKEKLFPSMQRVTQEMLDTDWVTFGKRVLLSIAIPSPFMSLFFIAPWSMENLFLLMVMKTLIPTLGTMFIMFLLSDRYFFKYKLLNNPQPHETREESHGPVGSGTQKR